MTVSRTDQILDFAEREMRKGGFDAVSFRDIASAIGIKSASVHYHFPTKADLGAGVTRRYADRFIDALGSPDDPTELPGDRMKRLANGYVDAYEGDFSACLCAVLGSVVSHVPDGTSKEVRSFFDRLEAWIDVALKGANTSINPKLIIGMLQGAMVLSIATGDKTALRDASAFVVKAVSRGAK